MKVSIVHHFYYYYYFLNLFGNHFAPCIFWSFFDRTPIISKAIFTVIRVSDEQTIQIYSTRLVAISPSFKNEIKRNFRTLKISNNGTTPLLNASNIIGEIRIFTEAILNFIYNLFIFIFMGITYVLPNIVCWTRNLNRSLLFFLLDLNSEANPSLLVQISTINQ